MSIEITKINEIKEEETYIYINDRRIYIPEDYLKQYLNENKYIQVYHPLAYEITMKKRDIKRPGILSPRVGNKFLNKTYMKIRCNNIVKEIENELSEDLEQNNTNLSKVLFKIEKHGSMLSINLSEVFLPNEEVFKDIDKINNNINYPQLWDK